MDERDRETRYPLPEVIQPDPMLTRHRGTIGTIAVSLGALAIVVLVLYGVTRPEGPQQEAASTPSAATQTAPAGAGAAPQPSTTGQAAGDNQAKPAPSQGKPERSDSSNNPGTKNQPQQQAQ